MSYKNYTEQDYNNVIIQKENGLNNCQISKLLNIPRSTIKTWIKTGFKKRINTFRLGYTDKDIIETAKKVFSMAELLRCLGLTPAGGNYDNMNKQLSRLNLACEHWTGQGWSNSKRLKDWKSYSRSSKLKPHLISLRGHKCEDCGLEFWKKVLIPLELHHIDGNRNNNEPTNLQLLCCNCHALTPNFRRSKMVLVKRSMGIKTLKNRSCPDCGETKSFKAQYCFRCSIKYRPSKKQ